ncbi:MULTISPECIES: mannitol dehydrogenase family protein [unclassified Rhizobium]|uniref:mannitol dehydrogenase family protein n=1 Tax=unclassified Rhizobium TaxID=2613769 RepID=UPI000EAA5B7B|nr:MULTISPECIES: mannitol dehydrogenase family protein [unclassified Rhizobium]AYG69809.1 mannitol dehydrogenase family protein [Rhizobium sp. CCGE531]AYG76184.1 mannitol dehydrogenase family protein [Rhizobium sp. CCGE532]
MSGHIIQFGTSRFLQAHVAFFVHEAAEAGQPVGPISVVQVSGDSSRSGRVAAFGRPEGYPVFIRGMAGGETIDRTVQVKSVDCGLSAANDWAEITRLFVEDADFVVSNTGDTGYRTAPGEDGFSDSHPPKSFPAKLAFLLCRRWQASARPLVVLPCELVTGNGQLLKKAVVESARQNDVPAEFFQWLDRDVAFADTLVDRIVSEPIEPVGAVAEPYALWAIRQAPGVRLPCLHEQIVLTPNLEPYERLKLHILNLGHTFLAEIWQTEGHASDQTVRGILADPNVMGRLEALYAREVVPGFALKGMGDEAGPYVAATLDRFRNPFLDHRIADIAQHHAQKVERRIAAFLDWVGKPPAEFEAAILREIASRYPASGEAA